MEQTVNFETAQLAKEKGFKLPCRFFYYLGDATFHKRGVLYDSMYDLSNRRNYIDVNFNEGIVWGENCISAPIQSLLQKWLREKHNIHIYVEPVWQGYELLDEKAIPEYVGWVMAIDDEDEPTYWKTYEEALESALIEGLNEIKMHCNKL